MLSWQIKLRDGQLDQMQTQQRRFEKALKESQKAPVPPYRQSFLPGGPTPKPPGMAQFAAMLGQAPRAKQSPFMTPPQKVRIPEDEPHLAPQKEGHVVPEQDTPPFLASAISQQTQAMTALVAHLVGQSDLSDLATGSSSMALSSRGSSKREKLQANLANRPSSFLLQVAQLAAKRSKPSERLSFITERVPWKGFVHQVPPSRRIWGMWLGYLPILPIVFWLGVSKELRR